MVMTSSHDGSAYLTVAGIAQGRSGPPILYTAGQRPAVLAELGSTVLRSSSLEPAEHCPMVAERAVMGFPSTRSTRPSGCA